MCHFRFLAPLALALALAGCSDSEQPAPQPPAPPPPAPVVAPAPVPSAPPAAPVPDLSGAPICLDRCTAERTRTFTRRGERHDVTFSVDMEYPSRYGLAEEECRRMTAFVNGILCPCTNFEALVDAAAQMAFLSLAEEAAKEDFQWETARLSLVGRMEYADARYFSYELTFNAGKADYRHQTFDRQLGRRLTTDDLVAPEQHPRLRHELREFAKIVFGSDTGESFVEDRPADWPALKEFPNVGQYGVSWGYAPGEYLDGWVDVQVSWDNLKAFVRDPGMVPPGGFRACRPPEPSAEADDWWRFPYGKLVEHRNKPPDPPFAGTNHPYASIELDLEYPVRGGMSAEKFAALQSCLGGVLTHGRNPHGSVLQGLDRVLVSFWDRTIREAKSTGRGVDQDSGYNVLSVQSRIPFRNAQYVCFTVQNQDGCPCCRAETNVVWSWKAHRPLAIEDILELKDAKEIKRMMREEVRREFASEYEDNPDVVLPAYAKDWPRQFANFRLDDKGLVWIYDAGQVLVGGMGANETRLTWEQLKPYLNPAFELPVKP